MTREAKWGKMAISIHTAEKLSSYMQKSKTGLDGHTIYKNKLKWIKDKYKTSIHQTFKGKHRQYTI